MSERDAWLSEMWKPCRELPLAERLEKRIADRKVQRHLEEQSVHNAPETVEKGAA
jgi:hypothetical protein